MIKRITAVALAVGVLGFTASAADAAVKAGTYKGATEQGAKVSLKVLSNKKAVINYSFEGAVMSCSDGQDRQLNGFKSPSSVKFKLDRKARFSFEVPGADGAVLVQVAGQVKSPKAFGGLRMQALFNETGQLDPAGTVQCDSAAIAWTTKRS
jgi:hypothetical protein